MSMDGFGDWIGLGFRSLIGFGVLFGLLFLAVNLHAKMWRALVARYGQTKRTPVLARKIPETIVILKSDHNRLRFGWHQNYMQYNGTIISIIEDGLLISATPPNNIIYKEIYLPFNEIKIGSYLWMLWKEPYAISMDKASDLKVIISQDTLQWLRRNTGRAPFCP